ncbi:MAG: NADH-quinone oxidoreductase subunit H [Clostridiales bacterium]|nr:NADH-quinone oxidoreductase subunit H [Clostridiales bacterium]
MAAKIISVIAYIVLSPILGGLLNGVDRKISARMQRRRGPSVFQPIYDIIKLLKKETVIVNMVQTTYILTFLILNIVSGALVFAGADLLLVLVTLTTSNIFLILAAASANSAFSHLGAQREIMQMLCYEPMVLITAVGFYIAKGSFSVGEIFASDTMPAICTIPGVFIAFLFILTIKLRKHPFDLSTSHHAHQELVKGITTELSGKLFAAVEIAHWYETIMLLAIIALFFVNSNPLSYLLAGGAVIICYFIEILIDNTNARFKADKMLKYSWAVTIVFGGVNILILDVFG